MNGQLLNRVLFASTIAIGSALSNGAAQAAPLNRVDLDPQLQSLFNANFVHPERVAVSNPEFKKVDPSKLWFKKGVDALDVFFINEGAGFRNQLLYSVNGGSDNLIFEDISSKASVLPEADGPLALGEGRRLGSIAQGSKLAFTILADTATAADIARGRTDTQAADREKYRYSTDEINPDQLQHLLAYSYGDYTILAFEDLYGDFQQTGEDPNRPGFFFENSDRDFNDVVIAVRGATTVGAEAVPEPGELLALAAVAGTAGLSALRRKVLG